MIEHEKRLKKQHVSHELANEMESAMQRPVRQKQ